MSERAVPDAIVSRLRANLRAAGIPFTEEDVAGLIEAGMLRTAVALEELSARAPRDLMPDYLDAAAASGGIARPAPPPAHAAVATSSSVAARSVAARPVAGGPGGTIAGLAPLIRAREVSPVELVERALERVARLDGELHAFQLVLAERARAAARRAEREIAARYRGPLHGVPVAVKDLFAMKGTRTTAGSKVLADWVADFDAAVVERLEAAGAVIVGKTTMPEFAYSPGSNNPHYGPTRNPWNPARDSGGSSSGSGAAVTCGMVWAALGSDTGGSIRIPAALCGIVGLKPTFGRVSLHGAVPLAWSLDHAGPMTRSVADAALVLEAIAGPDPRDPRTGRVPAERYADPSVLEAGVKGLRVGILRNDGSGGALASDEALAGWRRGLAALESEGATLVEIDLPELAALRVASGAILALEAATQHEAVLRERPRDLGGFMRRRLLAGWAHGPGAFVRAQQLRAALRRRAIAVFERVDLLTMPGMPATAPPLGVPASTALTAPLNGLGWPAISVPVGFGAERLPLGIQLVGRPWDEAAVLGAAHALETRVGRLATGDAP
jgi:aspartyl-tRNA(Asn)/glutamyl-tRNA(Gln) amidotransferase subunit A